MKKAVKQCLVVRLFLILGALRDKFIFLRFLHLADGLSILLRFGFVGKVIEKVVG